MPARLTSPHTFRERTLLYGGGGSGKTTAVLKVARMLAEGRMYVVDNDYSYAYTRALETEFSEVSNVDVFECEPDWLDMVAAVQRAIDAAGGEDASRDDWLVIDSISPSWEFVRSWVTEQLTGTDISEFLLDTKRSSKNQSEMMQQVSNAVPWDIVKKEYAKGIYIPIRKWPGHLILTAETKKIGRSDLDKPEFADLYSHIGQMPAGEGRLSHVTSTILYLTKKRHGEYAMTTVKDRNRPDLEAEPVEDFALDYLRDVAGWEITVVRS